MLEIESSKGKTTLLDRLVDEPGVPNAFIETIVRDQTASRLFEVMLAVAPDLLFASLWSTYLGGDRLSKLASHPVANFLVAKAIRRVDAQAIDVIVSTFQRDGTARKSVGACLNVFRPSELRS